jgi:RNA polymerase sigma factor (sigma-70 family)
MAAGKVGTVLRQLRGVLGEGETATDGQLLERFVATREELAFEVLVRRHGPMVLGVCRRILGHAHDAEDAFQATFLLLARKAASVRHRGAVGSWLYGVARRAALQAKRAAQRRRAREASAMPRPQAADDTWGAVREALDEEMARLPDRYRAVLILCDLEGQTRKEAARVLGWPEGTVASRLTRARRLLGRRLARHGLPLTASALAAALAEGASAALPSWLVSSTVKAAVLIAVGPAAATPAVALMKEVSQAMLMTKLKMTVAGVMVATLLGVSGLVYRAAGQVAPGEGRLAAKPRTELEALRHEVELLKFNLEVVLEKCRAQENELRALRGKGGDAAAAKLRDEAKHRLEAEHKARLEKERYAAALEQARAKWEEAALETEYKAKLEKKRLAAEMDERNAKFEKAALEAQYKERLEKQRSAAEKALAEVFAKKASKDAVPDPVQEIEAALKALRAARDNGARERAEEALEKAVKRLRQQH